MPFEAQDPGIYDGIPAEAYHRLPALSSSGCKTLITECAAIYRHKQDHPEEDEPDTDMLIGSAAHIANLEPHLWASKVVIIDAADWRKRDAQEAKATALVEGKVPLLTKHVDTVLAMQERFRQVVGDQLAAGRAEVSYLWREHRRGVLMKGRPDWRADDGKLLVDYKTTGNAHPDALRARVFDNWHHVQAALYIEGHEVLCGRTPDWLWIAQATKPPYLVTVARPTNATLHIALERADEAIRTYDECQRTGAWPSYAVGVIPIEPTSRATWQHADWTEQRQARQQDQKRRQTANSNEIQRAIDAQAPL